MKNISVALTEPQILEESKDVTRRVGWKNLKPGTLLQPVRKGQGLKKGEKAHKVGGPIKVVSVRRERLDRMLHEPDYGVEEVRREGFPKMSPADFVSMFCATHRIPDTRPWGLPKRRRQPFPMLPCDEVTRIEFKHGGFCVECGCDIADTRRGLCGECACEVDVA